MLVCGVSIRRDECWFALIPACLDVFRRKDDCQHVLHVMHRSVKMNQASLEVAFQMTE